jgi:DHA2 family multidrug resistance protein
MLNIVQQVGGSVGIALLSLTLSRRSAYHVSVVGSGVSVHTPAYSEAAGRVMARAHELGYTQHDSVVAAALSVARHIAEAARVLAFQDAFLVGALITFLAIAGVFFLPARPTARPGAEPVHLE